MYYFKFALFWLSHFGVKQSHCKSRPGKNGSCRILKGPVGSDKILARILQDLM